MVGFATSSGCSRPARSRDGARECPDGPPRTRLSLATAPKYPSSWPLAHWNGLARCRRVTIAHPEGARPRRQPWSRASGLARRRHLPSAPPGLAPSPVPHDDRAAATEIIVQTDQVDDGSRIARRELGRPRRPHGPGVTRPRRPPCPSRWRPPRGGRLRHLPHHSAPSAHEDELPGADFVAATPLELSALVPLASVLPSPLPPSPVQDHLDGRPLRRHARQVLVLLRIVGRHDEAPVGGASGPRPAGGAPRIHGPISLRTRTSSKTRHPGACRGGSGAGPRLTTNRPSSQAELIRIRGGGTSRGRARPRGARAYAR